METQTTAQPPPGSQAWPVSPYYQTVQKDETTKILKRKQRPLLDGACLFGLPPTVPSKGLVMEWKRIKLNWNWISARPDVAGCLLTRDSACACPVYRFWAQVN